MRSFLTALFKTITTVPSIFFPIFPILLFARALIRMKYRVILLTLFHGWGPHHQHPECQLMRADLSPLFTVLSQVAVTNSGT